MLNSVDEFIEEFRDIFRDSREFTSKWEFTTVGKSYCAGCETERQFEFHLLSVDGLARSLAIRRDKSEKLKSILPSLIWLRCQQCRLKLAILLHFASDSPELVVLPDSEQGIATRNAPKSVAMFLNEAYKASLGGAAGAALAMYRATLEQILFEEGYKTGMLDEKIRALETDIASGSAKPWAQGLAAEIMDVIKRLGNKVAHPKDLAALHSLNMTELVGVRETMSYLLYRIYERDAKQSDRMQRLKTIQRKISTKRKP